MLISATSFADDTDIDNTQVLTGAFVSSLRTLLDETEQVAAQSGAQGNTLSVDYTLGNVRVINNQSLDASGFAESIVDVNIASQGATSNATTLGNSATLSTCCGDILATSTQSIATGNDIGAVSNLNVYNWAMNPSTAALATGNAISVQTTYGRLLDTNINQTNQADIRSEAVIDGGGLLADSATSVSTAIANTGFVGGEQTSTITRVDQQSHGALVQALGGVISPNVEDVFAATTATGNNFVIENSFGYIQSNVTQNNTAYVRAQTDVEVGLWGNQNTTSAYAVGNSNLTSNIGSDIFLNNIQLNAGGGVEAISNFTGADAAGVGTGDIQVVSAAAFGNAVSGFVCSTCGGDITATNNQTNSADINARSIAISNDGGTVISTATAIGNSATYHTNTGD